MRRASRTVRWSARPRRRLAERPGRSSIGRRPVRCRVRRWPIRRPRNVDRSGSRRHFQRRRSRRTLLLPDGQVGSDVSRRFHDRTLTSRLLGVDDSVFAEPARTGSAFGWPVNRSNSRLNRLTVPHSPVASKERETVASRTQPEHRRLPEPARGGRCAYSGHQPPLPGLPRVERPKPGIFTRNLSSRPMCLSNLAAGHRSRHHRAVWPSCGVALDPREQQHQRGHVDQGQPGGPQ